MSMFSFLHLSDLHQTANREDKVYGTYPYQKLEAAISSINRHDVQLSFILITGDLSHDGTKESYNHVKTILQNKLDHKIPIYYTMGNHDNRTNFQQCARHIEKQFQ